MLFEENMYLPGSFLALSTYVGHVSVNGGDPQTHKGMSFSGLLDTK